MAVKYGKRGGVSGKNKDWKGYYGETAYNSYVARKKRQSELLMQELSGKARRQEELKKAIEEVDGVDEVEIFLINEAIEAEVAAYDNEGYDDYYDEY